MKDLKRKAGVAAYTLFATLGAILGLVFFNGSEAEKPGPGVQEAAVSGNKSVSADELWRELAKGGQAYDITDVELVPSQELTAGAEKEYTVMIYMIGSNLESRLGNATKDLEEIAASGYDTERVNVLVCTGGSRRWVGDVPSGYNCVLDMSREGDERILARTEENANMGNGGMLAAFVNFCDSYFPASHHALIFWDHGGGPLWGYGADELYGQDSLLLGEMQAAMRETAFGEKRKLDLVGFDACLMACIECMDVWKEFSDYYIASEELEPGDGWDYSFLGKLHTVKDTEEAALSIIDHFSSYYEARNNENFHPDVTLSCIRLAELDRLERVLDQFTEGMLETVKGGKHSTLVKCRADIKGVGLADGVKEEDQISSYDLVDLGDMAEELAWIDQEASEGLLEALSGAVVKGYSNTERLSGITIYYPYGNKSQFRQRWSDYEDMGVSDNYRFFLRRTAEEWLLAGKSDWNPGEIRTEEGGYSLELSEEEQENLAAAYYTILTRDDFFGFNPLMVQCRIEADDEGRLFLPEDFGIIVIGDEAGAQGLCSLKQIESGKGRKVYRTEGLRVDDSPLFLSGIFGITVEDVQAVLLEEDGEDEISIQMLTVQDPDVSQSGKTTIERTDWSGVQILRTGLLPTRDSDGRLLPVSEWKESGTYGWNELAIGEQMKFYRTPVAEIPSDELYLQFELEDVYGNVYGTELLPLPSNKTAREESFRTRNGELRFAVYDDHAVCTVYYGDEEKVEIPAEIAGKPVTGIGGGAFSGDNGVSPHHALKELVLPDSLKWIGNSAFADCIALERVVIPEGVEGVGRAAFSQCRELQSVSLPASLKKMGIGVFALCDKLEEIRLADGNTAYTLKDGMLYSADGTVLYVCPAAAEGSCTIAEGTVEIAYAACTLSSHSGISFPQSLEKIDDYAFYGAKLTAVPSFPSALKTIGVMAFGPAHYVTDRADIPEEQEEIFIGKEVRRIGKSAFDLFTAKTYAVDEENPYFSAVDGNLMNRAGDVLLDFATQRANVLTIPEGVTEFDADKLRFLLNYYGDTSRIHVNIPDSVKRVNDNASTAGKADWVLHCPEGSVAEEYAKAKEIAVSHEVGTAKVFITTEGKWVYTYHLYEDHAALVHVDPTEDSDYSPYGSYFDMVHEDDDEYLSIVSVPAMIEGRPVRTVGDGVNSVFDTLTIGALSRVELAEGIRVIADRGLESADIREIILPKSLKRIGRNAITMRGPAVALAGLDQLESLGEQFITGNIGEEFILQPSLKEIAPGAFSGCSGLKAFREGSGELNFCVIDGALYSKDGSVLLAALKDSASVADGTKSIGNRAFSGCEMNDIELPDSLESIGAGAFENCASLQSLRIPASVTMIGERAFQNCSSLKDITLPDNLTEIPGHMFQNCGGLKKLVIPEGVTRIGTDAFSGCDPSLEYSLPDSLLVIDHWAFPGYKEENAANGDSVLRIGKELRTIETAYSYGFTSFEVDPENRYFDVLDGFLTDRGHNEIIAVPADISGSVRIPEGVVKLGLAFSDRNGIKELYIPESVMEISDLPRHYDSDLAKSVYDVRLHVKLDSFAWRYAQKYGIPYVVE